MTQSFEILVLTKIDDKIFFYVPAIAGKRRLRTAITEPNIDKKTLEKGRELLKTLRRYYLVIKDNETGGFKIKFE